MIDSLMSRSRIRNILKLLREERYLILNGPLSELNHLAAKRDKLVENLLAGKIDLERSDIDAIKQEATHNQNLLNASLSGIRAAKTLLTEQLREIATMGTYTNAGKRLESSEIGVVKDKTV